MSEPVGCLLKITGCGSVVEYVLCAQKVPGSAPTILSERISGSRSLGRIAAASQRTVDSELGGPLISLCIRQLSVLKQESKEISMRN